MPLPTPSLTIAPSSLLLAVVAAVGMATIGVISRITGLNAESITWRSIWSYTWWRSFRESQGRPGSHVAVGKLHGA